jgi:hypothetical protein
LVIDSIFKSRMLAAENVGFFREAAGRAVELARDAEETWMAEQAWLTGRFVPEFLSVGHPDIEQKLRRTTNASRWIIGREGASFVPRSRFGRSAICEDRIPRKPNGGVGNRGRSFEKLASEIIMTA